MALFKSGNPTLNQDVFAKAPAAAAEDVMTFAGTLRKTGFLLLLVFVAAAITWTLVSQRSAQVIGWVIGGLIGGGVLGLIISFKPTWAGVLSPVYAACEGLFLGAISCVLEQYYPGIAFQAVGLTFGVLALMLVGYAFGIIRPTQRFKTIVITATGAIALLYCVSIVMSLFGASMPFIHSSGPIGIIFSVVVVGIAALNLVLDFDFIQQGCQGGAAKHMEWYAAFGLMVTLIWLYIELLRLLSKLRSRD